ncbi:MAG: monofunctional biosynthetic peptidoglycan transglycosylase [Hyphomicrobium sp.]|nr:monofunctional biosynthetic peptidoglycan transglycosylase [Hyphomicrobium sp.]
MERSDPPRPAAADLAAAKPEQPKPAAEGAPVPVTTEEIVESAPATEPEADAFVEAEPEAIEREHFELLERETTQPVRRYFEPRHVHDIAPNDVAHAADFEVPTEPATEPPPQPEPPIEQFPANETDAVLEPWPDPLRTTQPASAEPAHVESLAEQLIAPPDADAASYEAEKPSASTHAFEPLPFAVPPPGVYRSPAPPEPAAPEPQPVDPIELAVPLVEREPVAPISYEPPYVAPPRREPEPTPAPPPAFRHDVAAAWPPSAAIRREPSFHPAAYVEPAPAAPARQAGAALTRRDSRDLFRRAVRVAVLIFCGWFIAVLLLIAAFRFINPPFSMLMALQFMTGTPIHKQWVPIERISPNLTRAVIVAEDGRFCQHWGVDFIEAANAIRRASDGYPRGASTITMQVAKNLFLVPAKSYLRKIVEIPLTFAIELAWPKWRILEVYLNIVEWGPGIFGAEAASQAHFGRPAASLTSRQAAQLAVSLPNPIKRDAGSPGPRTAHRASVIQARAARTREASACVDGGR